MYQTRVSIFKVLKLYLFYFHNQTLTLKKLGNPFGVVNGIFLFLIGSSTEVLDLQIFVCFCQHFARCFRW